MSSRRKFMGQILGGATSLAAYGIFPTRRVLGANDRVRIGLIGAGGRGQAIFQAALRCANVEGVAVADVYTRRLEEVRGFVPNIKTHSDFRRLLDDKSIDAVLIATPQHQHALNFVPAIKASKDVYQEKTMAFNPDHARRMRAAFEGSGRAVQVGIQSISGPEFQKARELVTPERMGTITAIHTHHYRNAPYGGWSQPIPPDCDLRHVDWKAFEGEAKPHPFTPDRYMNWRFYWDYSGGNVFENMVHQVGFWYKVLDLKIPRSVTMSGANYLSPKMQVPDTMNVTMHQPENLLFTWHSMFGNNYKGVGCDFVLGNKGTVLHDTEGQVRYVPEGNEAASQAAVSIEESPAKAPDIVGGGDLTDVHMQNFIDCVRSRKEPNCPFEIGYRSAIACQMAIASYRMGKAVGCNPDREETSGLGGV
jgi:predicted dehydrogenase